MLSARALHTATALAIGIVLIAGGYDASASSLNSAELYDPITGLFEATGSMASERVAAEAVRLRGGSILIVGGQDTNGAAIASVELYDPITGLFSPTGPLQTARLNPTVTRLKDGRVLVAGGYGGASGDVPLATAEIYDPESGRFKETDAMSTARRNATSSRLRDGSILVAGGYNGEAVNAPEIFNPRTERFTRADEMSSARRYPTATLLPGGEVWLAGGFATAKGNPLNSSERFQSSGWSWLKGAGRFVTSGNMATARGRHTATRLGQKSVLIAGGLDGVKPLASAELYDIASQTFSTTSSMQTPRYRHTATPLPNGMVLIAGGADESVALATAELFDPNTQQNGWPGGAMILSKSALMQI